MRLTLRTLLAYMDDILDPADQEELGKKIESSAFATELIHRSRDTVRRLRLSAPDVLAGDSDDLHSGAANLDANTAAEYLDNTLSPDGVAEFERSCLEAGPNADMLLAEAASCHHVLTMVLGEPAEVDAELRQRMYALAETHSAPEQVQAVPAHQTPGLEPAAVVAAPPRASRVDQDEAEAPDYMLAAAKARRRTQRFKAAAVLVALLLGGAATWLLWPAGEVEAPKELAAAGGGNIGDLELGEPQEASVSSSTGDSTAAATTDASSAAPPFDGSADSTAPTFTPTPPAEAPAVAPVLPPELPPVAPIEVDEMEVDVAAAEVASTDAAVPSDALTTPPAPPAPPAEAGGAPTGATAAPPVTPALPTPPAGDVPATAAAVAADSEAPMAVPDAIVDGATSVEETPAVAATPKQIGAYLGANNDMLLRFDAATSIWVRLPPRSALTYGDRLLSLPTFRTHVVLGDANVHLAGGAEIELYAPAAPAAGEAPAEFGVRLPHGRLILNSGLNGNRIEMDLAGDVQVVNLAPTSSLAIDVHRIFEPGAGKHEPAPAEVEWFLTSGTLERASAAEGGAIEAPATWITGDVVAGVETEVTPTPIDDLPEWVDREMMTASERRAHDKMAESLAAGEPVGIRLLELSDPTGLGRLTELFALAAESGTYVGQFDPVVKALGDVKQRASWKNNVAALRQAIARNPAAAEAISAAFASQLGESAASDLMEMVMGFDAAAVGATRAQWQEGALLRLVRWLDNDNLTYRVLASYNLNEITGMRELGGYRPEQTASQRKIAMNHYWKRLEDGDLKPRNLPTE